MNKRVKIAIQIALIGVFAILTLQALWMSTSYKQEQRKLVQKATPIVEDLTHGIILKKSKIWADSIRAQYGKNIRPYIGGVDYSDSLASIKVFNPETGRYTTYKKKCNDGEELIKYATRILYHTCGLDIEHVDQQLTGVFRKYGIFIPYIIEKVDTRTGKVEQRTYSELPCEEFTTRCDTLHLGITGTDGIVVKFDGSYGGMIKQIRFIILSSFLITLMVAVILFGIIRIIVYQQKLSDFRENFVRHMIHEIKNPIAYLKRVLEVTPDLRDEALFRTADRKIDRINLLIETLLSASSNKLVIQKQPIDIRATLESIGASYPDAEVMYEIEEGVTTFQADRVHYANALLNLVDNAIKYSPAEKRVAIRCFRDHGSICVSVRDWGVGIPVEFRLLIFDRYFRVPSRKSVDVSGFGLGLSYVRMVAEAHRGEVTFSSNYKQGSLFTIRIPNDNE